MYESFEELLNATNSEDAIPEELKNLRAENERLKYRLGILQRAVAKEEAKPTESIFSHNGMKNVIALLESEFRTALERAYPDLWMAPCPVSRSTKNGDYQFNGAMGIAGLLNGKGKNLSPRDVADRIVGELDLQASGVINKAEVSGPGFINIYVKPSFVCTELQTIVSEGVHPPFIKGITDTSSGKKKKVIIDYSSPNIAKELHVGNLRSTIIGDATANFVEFLGCDVLRLNHVGDWGTQFGMLIAHLQGVLGL